MISVIAIVISFFAFVVATFSLVFTIEKLRLDLYNKRFDIYLRTLKLYQGLVHGLKEGTIHDIHTDFVIAFRESKFLFRPDSGIYELLDGLNKAATKIMVTNIPEGLPPAQFDALQQERTDALTLWNSSIVPLENLMAPYLNYHYTSVVHALREWAKALIRRVR